MCRLDPAEQHVGVGDRQRPAAAVAGRARTAPAESGPDLVPAAVEVQHGPAARRDRVDGQHRRAQPHPGHLGRRTQGWRGPLARQMAGWLAFLFVLGLAKNLQGGMVQIDNAAHIGGALGGVIVAATWRRGVTYSEHAQRIIVGACIAVVLARGLTVYVRDRTDPYLFMTFNERLDAASRAARSGRCDEAERAMKRAERLDPGSQRVLSRERDVTRQCLTDQH